MAMKVDVTKKVRFGNSKDNTLPIVRCVCGNTFLLWDFVIDIYDDTPSICPRCGAKLYFVNDIKVYQVVDEVWDDGE